MKIKPILVVGQLPPPVHGSNIMTDLFLKSLMDIGVPFRLVEKKFSIKQRDVGKLRPTKALKIPFLLRKLYSTCVSVSPNLCVFFVSLGPLSFLIDAMQLFIIKSLGSEYLLYIHGLGVQKLVKNNNFIIKAIAKKVFGKAYGAIVLGERLKEDVFPFLVSERVFVLPNAIPDMTLRYAELFSNAGNQDGKLNILYLSNMRPAKGTMDFLEMARRVYPERKHVRFIIAGPYREERFFNEMLHFIQQEKLESCVQLVGAVSGRKKAETFAKSHIFVFPSHQEAFPLVNLEAMQCALPIVTTNVGSVPEIVRNNVNGFIVNPQDVDALTSKVLRLIDDSQLREKMGRAGRTIYEKEYSIENYKDNLQKLLAFIQRELSIL